MGNESEAEAEGDLKMNGNIVEICCGSYSDALRAAEGGADRIELNSALQLGGLSPSSVVLRLVREKFPEMKIIAMVRPRGAGFCYREEEFQVMKAECRELLSNGADGIAFGCLLSDGSLDMERNKIMVSMIKETGKEAVFHRAFDCVKVPFETTEQLIELGVDRILTSGQQPKAMDGITLLRELQQRYGSRVQILAGSGVNSLNVRELIKRTGITQVHSSCKAWAKDPTTVGNGVSFSLFGESRKERPEEQDYLYDAVSVELVKELVRKVRTEDDKRR